MKKFEYYHVTIPNTFSIHNTSFMEFLNEKGALGWDVVTIIHNPFVINNGCVANYDIYFKREIK